MNIVITGADELIRNFSGSKSVAKKELTKGMLEVALKIIGTAKKFAPRSPTKEQFIKGKKFRNVNVGGFVDDEFVPMKKRVKTTRKDFHPGILEKSIGIIRKKILSIDLGVPTNSGAGEYAKWIHDKKNKEGGWKKRGVGTVAKGSQADDKYLYRAVVHHEKDLESIVLNAAKELAKTLVKN
jgi:hypothetical protein